MREDIKKRIEQVQAGEIPAGYQCHSRIGLAPADWKTGQLSNVVKNVKRPVPKPSSPYWRLGIRSHARGTFHEFVENPDAVAMDELFQVEADDLIVNITFAWEHAIALAGIDDAGKLVSHRFPTYIFKNGNTPKYFESIVVQHKFKEMLANISPGGAGRNRVLNKTDLLKLPCYLPPEKEQQKIAEILNYCDKVIELKEQLIEEERNRKKWLMQNLFDPDSGIRLQGFSGEWKNCTLNDIGKFSKGTGISNDDCISGQSPCIKYGDIYMSYGEYFRESVSKTVEYIAALSPKAKMGALFFTASGEDRLEIGKCAAYLGETPISVGGDIVILQVDTNRYDPMFLSYQQNTEALIKQKAAIAQGYSIVHLYGEQVKKLLINVPPTKGEQIAISSLLASSDSKIAFLWKELMQWQQKKKALMQLLLTGLVRVTA